MSLYLGVDLGSTTSKAVLIDDQEQVVGRGITNTRSNYDVAVEVARREAVRDAQLRRVLPAAGPFAARLTAALHLAEDLATLERLRATCRVVAGAIPGEGPRLVPAIDALLARLGDEAETIFAPDARDRGSFFRDVVGARFYQLLDDATARGALDFDRASGIYDRSILEVENQLAELPFPAAISEALSRIEAPAEVRRAVEEVAREVVRRPLTPVALVGTGYGRARLPFPRENIRSEILCHGLGAHALLPATRTVLDIGGQDTKAIQIDDHGLVTGFQMNDRCAAGCGRYLGYIADELNLGLHELGPLALTATRPNRITSTCTVFAGVELRDLLSVGEKRENVLAGLHRAIITRAMSLLARSGGVHDQLTFTGGVARNPAAVAALRELVRRHYGERTLNVHADSIFTGALGAALFAHRGVPAEDLDDHQECTACTD